MPKTAQIFLGNGQQAARLPEEMRLSGTEVDVLQDESTGNIILSHREAARESEHQNSWEEFFRLRDDLTEEERAAFVIPRDRTPPEPRDSF